MITSSSSTSQFGPNVLDVVAYPNDKTRFIFITNKSNGNIIQRVRYGKPIGPKQYETIQRINTMSTKDNYYSSCISNHVHTFNTCIDVSPFVFHNHTTTNTSTNTTSNTGVGVVDDVSGYFICGNMMGVLSLYHCSITTPIARYYLHDSNEDEIQSNENKSVKQIKWSLSR